MAAPRNNIHYIPLGSPFLRTLVDGLLHRSNGDPQALMRMNVLLPTRRAVREMVDLFLDATGGKPILLPRLQAIADVDDEELEIMVTAARGTPPDLPVAITPLAREMILVQLIRARGDTQDYTRATALAAALAQLMDSVENEGLSLDQLDALVAAEFATHWQVTLQFLDIIRHAWPAILAERGQVGPATRRNMLLHLLADHWRDMPPDHPVIIAGVSGSLPAVAGLMDVVRHLPQGEIILSGFDPDIDAVAAEQLDPQHPQFELQALLRRFDVHTDTVTVWPQMADHPIVSAAQSRRWLWQQVMAPASFTANWANLRAQIDDEYRARIQKALSDIQVVEADTPRDEALAIAMLVRRALLVPAETVAIVTPDRALARDIMQACARFGIAVNDSAGLPLSETTPARLMRLLLQVVETDFHPVAVLALLRHPMVSTKIFPSPLVDMLDRFGLRGLRPGSTPDDFMADITKRCASHSPVIEMTQRMMAMIAPLCEAGARTGHGWVTAHVRVFEDFCGDDASIWHDDAGEVLAGLLSRLLDPAAALPDFDRADYTAFIDHLMGKMPVNTKGNDHPRVALLGVYESRLMAADHVILAGFNEGGWPVDPGADPWMSRAMRREFGLPAREVSVGRTALDVLQLVAAPHVVLTRTRRVDGAPSIPSRWLQRLDTLLRALDIHPDEIRANQILTDVRAIDAATGDITPVTRPAPCPPVAMRPTELSATQIETLMCDPYGFYADKILRLRQIDELDMDVDQRITGIVMHRVLQLFVAANPDALPPDAASILYALLDRVLGDQVRDSVIRSMITPRLRRALDEYLVAEEEWRETGARALLFETKWSMAIDVDQIPHLITARLDRLDRTVDGRAAVLDYKTGSTLPSIGRIETGVAPQLPVELMVVEQGAAVDGQFKAMPVAVAGLWQVNPRQSRIVKWETDGKNDIDMLRAQTHDGVLRLLRQFRDPAQGYASLPDAGRVPKFSNYTHLARVEEWGGALAEEESE